MTVSVWQFAGGDFDFWYDNLFELDDEERADFIPLSLSGTLISFRNPDHPTMTGELIGSGFTLGDDGPSGGVLDTIRIYQNGVQVVALGNLGVSFDDFSTLWIVTTRGWMTPMRRFWVNEARIAPR